MKKKFYFLFRVAFCRNERITHMKMYFLFKKFSFLGKEYGFDLSAHRWSMMI